MNIGDKAKRLIEKGLATQEIYAPEIFRLNNPADKKKFELIADRSDVVCYDQMRDQLKELIKSRNPQRKLGEHEFSRLIKVHLAGCEPLDYGVWVYYPWSGRVVHLLDKDEFIELRTAANRHKITTAERDILATKTIGVIGLSVGQSVSVTLALERGCGALRLADFDTLELNNLNRLRAGVHNLGLMKAYIVAREIAEIDPFFKVSCYTEGINEDNIHDFLTKDGRLDMLIDECDSVHIKILCRQRAKEQGIPVVMEASDRGTLDVERFDLEPNRPIMHGWLDHLDIDFGVLKNLKTTEEKLPYILPISGLETLSARMKASMVEIENTITTWPQLASAVALGGAITADTCRRIFLNQFVSSGRFFIDMEQLLPDERPGAPFETQELPKALSDEEMVSIADRFNAGAGASSAVVDREAIINLVTAAISAPTAGNNQPWKWLFENDRLYLFHERNRSFSFGDFENIASYVGLGAALENLELTAWHMGVGTELLLFPAEDDKRLVAILSFTSSRGKHLYQPDRLYKFIDTRFTNRNLGARVPIAQEQFEELELAVASIPGASLAIRHAQEDLQELGEIMAAADRLRLLHPDGHYEFYNKELRWNAEHSRVTADGIDIATVDITPVEVVGLKLVKDPRVVQLLIDWNAGNGLKRTTRKSVDSASAIALVTMPEFSSRDYLLGGRAVERMWLKATELDISLQPMVAAILHFARLNYGNGAGMPDFMKKEFTALYSRFIKIFPEAVGRGEIFLCRLCIAEKPAVKSLRIPVEKVLKFGS